MSTLFAASSAPVDFPILSALVVTPIIGALLLLLLSAVATVVLEQSFSYYH